MEREVTSILPFAGLLFVWAIAFVAMRNKRHRADAQREVQLALLNKFNSGDEMTHFLSTEEGRRLVDQFSEPSRDDPRQRAVGMLVGGCIMTALSIGFTILAFYGIRGEYFVIPAVINGVLGIGIFAGAALSLRVSRKLGLIKER